MGVYTADGHISVNVVDGQTLVGLYAMDGSWNVVDTTGGTAPVGVYAACGAYNVTFVSGTSYVGRYAANGSINVVNGSSYSGMIHPCGAINVLGSQAANFLLNETNGLVLDFTDDSFFSTTGFYGSAMVKDVATPANVYHSSPDKAASSLLTYTSPSVKMTMGPSGVLRYQAHNLCLQSDNLAQSTPWARVGVNVPTTSVDDPFGGLTGWSVTETSATSVHRITHSAISVTTGATYEFSFYFSSLSTRNAEAILVYAATYLSWSIDRSTGAVTAGHVPGTSFTDYDIAVTAVGSFWKVVITTTIAGSATTVAPYLGLHNGTSNNYAGNGTSGVIYYGPHIRRTPSDSTYLATTTAARYALPLEWSSAGVLQGPLVEEARTNRIRASEDLDNATYWTIQSSVPTGRTGPELQDGIGSWEIIAASGTVQRRFYDNASSVTLGIGQSMTASVYAQAGTHNFIGIRENGTTGSGVVFNLSDGSNFPVYSTGVITTSSPQAQNIGNGWWRLSCVFTASSASTYPIAIVMASPGYASGDPYTAWAAAGTETFYVDGLQLEAGSFPTSYIQTFASTVTRAADNISLATSAFPYNQPEGTVYCEITTISDVSAAVPVVLSGGGTTARVVHVYLNTSNILSYNGTGNVAVQTAAPTINTNYKLGMGYKTADYPGYSNGVAGTPRTDAAVNTATILHIGSLDNSDHLNGLIKKLAYFPRRMSNAELQTLTT